MEYPPPGFVKPKSEPTLLNPASSDKFQVEDKIEVASDGQSFQKNLELQIVPFTSPRGANFLRFWSETDEIVILKGIIDYVTVKKCNPQDYLGDFLNFIKESLHVNPSRDQLGNKMIKLKQRYENNKFHNRSFSNEAFQLCQKIWGCKTIAKNCSRLMVENEDVENMIVEEGIWEIMAVRKRMLWTEADEFLVLKGMIDYAALQKCSPDRINMCAFHDFIKGSLHVDASKDNLVSKIRTLKKKFENNKVKSRTFSDEAFQLCQKIWEVETTGRKPLNIENVGNIDVADGTLEGMSIQKNLVSSFGDVNVEEKILRKCVELFEGENVVESSKRKRKFSLKNRWIVTSIPGAWSEADEIVILKGMIYFAAKKKKASPIDCTCAFHDFIMEFLHVNPSRQQLSAKIKELKEKYERNKVQKRTFSKEALELCQILWGTKTTMNKPEIIEGAEIESNEVVENIDVTDGSLVTVETKLSFGGVNVEENILRIGAGLFEGGNDANGAKRWRSLLIEEMKVNLRELNVEEMKLQLKRKELDIEEIKIHLKSARTKLVLDSLEMANQ